ncbi:MAG: group II intron reverse transcriptase/maturase [Desulfobacteraceae bacterium]|nr:group II intron reverse transcriptase/maturase [Desulfobacteraceae bacterium]
MENTKRARKEKSRIRPSGETYVEPKDLLSGLERVREAARRDSQIQFTSLFHHITVDLLRESYRKLNPKAAPGVDDVTWAEYGNGLESRLAGLHDRVHNGRYRAKPSKRTYVPKDDGKQRPIGIAALEDKIVQHAVVQLLMQIYEEVFLGVSYGFRPKRSVHNALDAIWVGITRRKVNWILDADVRNFFGELDHKWLLKFLEHRVGDPRILGLIKKWLRAGVSEEGEWSRTVVGTPQGSVISPMLANIYLHYVLDLWVQQWRKKGAKGEVIIVRYADDFVIGFQYREDAERLRKELEERMQQFGLEMNSEKTRLIEFGRFAIENRAKRGEGKSETFDFLGFTHICAKTRKDGYFTVKRKSISKRLRRKVKEVGGKLNRMRHAPVPDQGKWLRSVIQGFYNYHAVPGNRDALDAFRTLLARSWFQSLRRRSQKARSLKWERMQRIIDKWLPHPRILHPYPNQRLCVTHPR